MAGGTRSAQGRGRLVVTVGALVLALVSACSGGSDPQTRKVADSTRETGHGQPTLERRAAPPARVDVSPGRGAQGVSPISPVVVKASGGTLTSVTVTNPQGREVKGTLAADRLTWTSAEELGYSKTYTVTAVATNADGTPTTTRSTFTTVRPANFTLPYLTPDGGTYGVGQPVAVHFDEPIPDKAAAERALTVTTSPHVEGAWHWFSRQDVHWRPKEYWAPGTKVTVRAKVYGVNLGNGLYGQEDKTASFTIGASKIAIVDDHTHMMQVFINGKKAHADIPVSMGRGGCITVKRQQICFTTQSGPHVVTEKYRMKHMSSASYGLPEDDPLGYSEDIPLAVRISGSGEFVHAAPWSVRDQGVRNVSHGCVNISPANAQWFYNTFGPGDVVDIRNTGVKLPAWDGYGDWVLSWSEWLAGSALR
jgi:lipoprotein-anchoring transpeptidase ErfK/SrfK